MMITTKTRNPATARKSKCPRPTRRNSASKCHGRTRRHRHRINLPGEIHPNDDRLAHLVPRYDGIVTEVRARGGGPGEKDQVLAIIESDQSLAPYPLKTSIAGTVIEKHITMGEAASRDRAPFVVADLSTVWLDLYV